jgi:hypothetical protein
MSETRRSLIFEGSKAAGINRKPVKLSSFERLKPCLQCFIKYVQRKKVMLS